MEELYTGSGYKLVILPTESFSDYVEHPQIRSLYLTDVGFFPTARGHFRERKNGSEEYIFFFCTEGEGTIIVEGKEYILRKNEAFCIPRLKSHRYFASEDDPWSILWVHIKGEDTCFYPLDECRLVAPHSQNVADRMQFYFEQLFRVLEGNYTLGNFIYISQILSVILSEAYHRENNNTTMEPNKHVTAVVKYMNDRISENLTLDQIAQEFELSRSYLNAVFQKYTKHAPMDFFLNLKMKEACKLLRTTDYYIYEVAQRLGYSDQYYFSRIFKRVIGMSPKEYKLRGF